jgi:hypothetical protein
MLSLETALLPDCYGQFGHRCRSAGVCEESEFNPVTPGTESATGFDVFFDVCIFRLYFVRACLVTAFQVHNLARPHWDGERVFTSHTVGVILCEIIFAWEHPEIGVCDQV